YGGALSQDIKLNLPLS
ncbi:acyltransferase family protein, partial [Chlamydia psittaci 03DC29]